MAKPQETWYLLINEMNETAKCPQSQHCYTKAGSRFAEDGHASLNLLKSASAAMPRHSKFGPWSSYALVPLLYRLRIYLG